METGNTKENTSSYSNKKKQALAPINEIEYEIAVLDNELTTTS